MVSWIDHLIRPTVISVGTRIPFLGVFFGIIGGAMVFGLIGLFLGPITPFGSTHGMALMDGEGRLSPGKQRKGWLAVLVVLVLLLPAVAPASPEIQGVYSLRLGQSPEEARATLAENDRFQRIAGRYFQGFPLYHTSLGKREVRVRPSFQDDLLVEIELRFRREASTNEVSSIIRDQALFAVETLSRRFGEPDRTAVPLSEIVPKTFRDGEQVVTHEWQRGERLAEVALWRDGFEHGVAIALAEQHTREQGDGAVEAF
ncbi:AI-2E family transporter [Thiohalorhabdus sp.]|uniref:AI-2E family transporter n=1 Tax=Thiohalorhabdus sp. TaxID=3094134 RepID=UPI002FC37C96